MTHPTSYDPPPGVVALGARVEVELLNNTGDVERLAFDLAPDSAADFDAGFLGAGTPLARAIIGRPVGARVPYRQGDVIEATILAVTPSVRAADLSAAAARTASTDQAVERAKVDVDVQLALTVNIKWGDYDPGVLPSGHDG